MELRNHKHAVFACDSICVDERVERMLRIQCYLMSSLSISTRIDETGKRYEKARYENGQKERGIHTILKEKPYAPRGPDHTVPVSEPRSHHRQSSRCVCEASGTHALYPDLTWRTHGKPSVLGSPLLPLIATNLRARTSTIPKQTPSMTLTNMRFQNPIHKTSSGFFRSYPLRDRYLR